jgi:hypothetical protein
MNSTQALTKARKLLGPKAMIEVRRTALIGEAREAAEVEYAAARAKLREAKEAKEARYIAVLKADAEFQRLKSELKEAEEREAVARHAARLRRVRVLVDKGWACEVKSEGDNFDEALAALEAKKAAA